MQERKRPIYAGAQHTQRACFCLLYILMGIVDRLVRGFLLGWRSSVKELTHRVSRVI